MEIKLKVTGMSCGGCAAAVKNAVLKVPGVARAEVDLAAGSLTAELDEKKAALNDVKAAVAKAGFGIAG